jgi:ribulose-5-phosphate 4-epimerase/fuculose-1-phosphate aldolase
MQEEGYIKFHCMWIEKNLSGDISISDLNYWREKLYQQKLIGAYPNGVGYGNISIRLPDDTFLITGTRTGNFSELTKKHYTIVTGYDITHNQVTCKGPIMASSESLTHAILYELLPEVNAVVHIHNEVKWDNLIDKVPTTSPKVEYGTPEMADEIKRLIDSENLSSDKVLVMAGHKDGLIAFGGDLAAATNNFF